MHKYISELYNHLDSNKNSKKVFAQIGSQRYTYGQVLQDIYKLNHLFNQKGLKEGDRVVLSIDNDYYTSLFFLAFLRYGITAVMIDPNVPVLRAIALIKKADVQGFVMDEKLFNDRNIRIDETPFILKVKPTQAKKGRLFSRLLKGKKMTNDAAQKDTFPSILEKLSSAPTDIPTIQSSTPAYVMFTSGTTSQPKGVMISHENLSTHLQTLSKVYGLNEDSQILNILMLYHADGIIQGPLLSLYNECTWNRPSTFDVTKIVDLFHSIYKYRITHFIAVPTILSFMNKFSEGYEDSFDTPDFQFIVSVAAKLELNLWETFEQKFGVKLVNVYGLTETVAGSLFCGVGDFPRKRGTIGQPVDCEAKITEDGRLWLKGKHIFVGYLNDETATAKAFDGDWFDTGDLATSDEDGFYKITGRVKNMVSYGGINIYPEQITEMINTHPVILEGICFGIPDEVFGEKLVAAVQIKTGETLSELAFFDFLRPLLEQNQLPKQVHFLDELPKGLSGKVQLKTLQALISKNSQGLVATANETYEKAVIVAASNAFKIPVEKLTMKDTSATLDGWDSMAHLEFITLLENQFETRFSTAEMMTMNSLKAAETMLSQKLE